MPFLVKKRVAVKFRAMDPMSCREVLDLPCLTVVLRAQSSVRWLMPFGWAPTYFLTAREHRIRLISMRILLLEDHEASAHATVRILERLGGYNVRWEGTVAGAKRALEEEKFDLALLDINLPDGNGLELMQEIKTCIPDLPGIAVTSDWDVERSLEAGFAEHITKPIDFRTLLAAVARA